MSQPLNNIITTIYKSPVGELILGSIGDTLCMCDWIYGKRRESNIRRVCGCLDADLCEGVSDVITVAANQLDEYFSKKRMVFDIPLVFTGTDFQNLVWRELPKIPYATVVSYSEVAQRINRPMAVRAVASAIASNPISIFVPCHRVVGSNKNLTGYNGGLTVKATLLQLESDVP